MRALELRVLALALAVGLGPGATAGAAVFRVIYEGDSGDGSLRQAILDANASADAENEIVIDLLDGTVIQLAEPLPDIEGDVVLNAEELGMTAEGIVIRGDGGEVFRVGSGTVQLTDLIVESGQLRIAGDATLSFDQTVDGVLAETITEDGGLEKLGPASLTLSGSNDYGGGTAVRQGTLIGDAGSIPGDVTVGAGSTLRFEQAGSGTYAGNLLGTGRVQKESTGTLTLAGNNGGFGGTFEVNEGTLRGSTATLPFAIRNNATLTFDQSRDGSYTGGISGTGSVRKEGPRKLTLPGTYYYSGDTVIAGGELELTGALRDPENDVTVQNGARLSGDSDDISDGIWGRLIAESGGTIAPGSSIGMLWVTSLTFESGSIFEVELDPDDSEPDPVLDSACLSNSDCLRADNAATIEGGSIDVILLADPHLAQGEDPRTFTIIDAGSTNGGFFDSSGDLALFDVEQIWDGSDLKLALSRSENGLVDVAATSNQRAVATVLEAEYPAAEDSDLEAVFDGFAGLSTSELEAAFDAIGGEGHTAFTTAQIAHADAFARTISSRMAVVSGRAIGSAGTVDLVGDLRRGIGPRAPEDLLAYAPLQAGGIQAAAAAPDVASGPPESGQRFGLWADGVGLLGGVSGDGNSADTSWMTGGANLGFDVRLGRHVLLGAGGGYGRLNVEVDDRGFDGDANVFQGALYAAWVGERAYVSGLGRYAWVDFETRRDITFDGIDRSARADYDGHELGGYLEAGFVAFAPAGVQLEPIAAFRFLRLERDGFTESGAGSLNLEADDDSWSSLVASGGLRVHKAFVFEEGEGLRLLPELRVRYGYEFGDDERDLDAVLTGATQNGAYSLTGATAARGGLLLGAGWSVLRRDDLGFFFQYDANLNSDLLAHALVVGVVIRW